MSGAGWQTGVAGGEFFQLGPVEGLLAILVILIVSVRLYPVSDS